LLCKNKVRVRALAESPKPSIILLQYPPLGAGCGASLIGLVSPVPEPLGHELARRGMNHTTTLLQLIFFTLAAIMNDRPRELLSSQFYLSVTVSSVTQLE
jgi:hypothetical protein